MGKKNRLLAWSCSLFFLSFGLCGTAFCADDISLRLKWVFDPGFAGELVAAQKGIFLKNGIKIQIKPGGFEADPIKMVASGSDTFGVTGADNFLIARDKGIPIVAIAAGYLTSPVVFYVHENSEITSPFDFSGQKVGYQAGQDTGTVYEALLKKLRIDRKSVKEIPVKYDFTPFLTRAVDVWPGYAANQSYILSKKNVGYRTIAPSDYGLNFLGTVYFVTEKTLHENPDLVDRFVKSLVEGWTLAYSDKPQAINAIESFDKSALTPELIEFMLDAQKDNILPKDSRYCEFSIAQWEELNSILIDLGLIKEPVDLDKAIDLGALRKIYNN